MSRCMLFPPPGYLWNGVGGQPLIQLIKLNANRERKKEKRRRKEKRKRREHLETVEQRRKDLDSTSLTEKVKPAQPMEFHFQHDSSENFQIIERRKAIVLHPNGQHDHGNGVKSLCACWVLCLHHSDIDVGLLPCLFELGRCVHQVLSSKQIDIFQQVLGSRPFCEFHYPNGKLKVISDSGSLLIESQFRELILNWVPPPLETPNTEFGDQQWPYDRGPLRNDTSQKTSAASNDHFCYPYTTLF
ncbi:hypothetical protein ABKV19_001159 [Rosa sericea]